MLRLGDTLAARGGSLCRGIILGILSGLVVESLLAVLTLRMDRSPLTPGTYLRLALRLPTKSEFHSACLVFLLWFGLSPGRYAPFKIAWLVAAFISAAAIVNSSNARIHRHQRTSA